MPVTHTDFAFTEESFDPTEYPDEIRPTYKSDRFPFTVPKTKVDPDIVSKTALQVRDRLAETAGVAREEIPEGLLRAVEAADVWPDENVRNAASGRVRSISTEVGEFLVVDFWANPCVVAHDPNNGRTTADARDKGLPYLEAIRDDAITGAPVLSVKDAAELIVGIEETASALGFVGAVVDSKDLHDINWIGLQGVHEPILLTPTMIEDEHGNQSWILKVDDGNRRLAMLRRCLRQCTNLSLSEIEAWSDHFRQPNGTVSLRNWTAADVAAVRRKATYKDASNYWRPASGSEDAVQGWLDASNVVKRTVVRTSVVPARLVVGYRNLKGSPAQNSSSMEVVQRYIRRTHIKTAAQREWSDATQSMQVALDVMRRMQVRSATVQGYTMALSQDELKDVYGNRVIDWAGAKADAPNHPLRLAAKATASFICTDMTADGDVKLSLTAHSMSTHHTKIREHRAEVAASVAMPILGLKPNGRRGGDYARARAVVDRASRHVMFGAVKRHPDGATNPWWRYLNHSVDELRKLANQEFDNGMDGAADEKGVGGYGSATRALLFLAILGLVTNPAIRTPLAGEAASAWQLTLNGLGGSRGNTLTTPDLVMANVLARFKKQGVEQLAAVVGASLAGAIPPNTIDRNAVATDAKGIAIERTRGTLTEEFLRSDALGWTRTGGGTKGGTGGKGGTPPAPTPPGDPYDAALDALSGPIEQAAASVAPFRDPDSEVGLRFANSGLPANYTQSLGDQIRAVQELLLEGSFIARSRGGNASAVFEDAGGDQ